MSLGTKVNSNFECASPLCTGGWSEAVVPPDTIIYYHHNTQMLHYTTLLHYLPQEVGSSLSLSELGLKFSRKVFVSPLYGYRSEFL